MYTRNFNNTSRSIKRTAEPSPESTATDNEQQPESGCFAKNDEQTISDTPCAEQKPTHTEKPIADNNNATQTSDADSDGIPFGAHGIPPQPLRRRKLPSCVRNSPPCEPILPDLSERETAEKAPSKQHHSEPILSPPSETRPPCEPAHGHRPPQKDRAFSTEELLLGGLIILLINDQGNDDIILILAFLLVSCF